MNCSVPACGEIASKAFALAPVCEKCRHKLQAEAEKYYRLNFKCTSAVGRPIYESIIDKTVWGSKN